MMGSVIPDPGNKAIKAGKSVCPKPKCNQDTYVQICPNCHGEIPHKSWDAPSLTLTIVGSTGAGKSVYLNVAMEEFTSSLPQNLGPDYGVHIVTEKTREKININKSLLQAGGGLQTTRTRIQNPDVRVPFLFSLSSFRYRKGFRPLKKKLNTFLTIFDAAGEDFNDQSDAHTLKQIPRADGLIMFIDPLSFPGYAQLIGRKKVSEQHPSQIMDVFYNVYIQQQGGKLRQGDKIKVPTAFVLGKADLFPTYYSHLPEIMNLPEHKGGVDLQALERSSGAAQKVVGELGGDKLIGVIQNRFANYNFFVVQSGTEDAATGRFETNPFRVLDPLLWILLQNDRLPPKD